LVTVIGVRFRHGSRMYYFSPGAYKVGKNDFVIVETSRGVEYGMVVTDPRLIPDDQVQPPLRTILRKASQADKDLYNRNLALEKEAFAICQDKIKQHKLDMKLVDVEYTFDARKILFYFTAAERVDFRDLVKDLAVQFHTRIELRQIGVRDEARMDGGYGICGRPYCCATFLTDFSPVSIKMAKDQNLSLSPSKISGTCGRLMCCLRYEESTYEELTRGLPQEGDIIETPKGTGEVLHVNVLRQLIKVGIAVKDKDDVEISEFPLSDITILKRGRRSRSRQEDQPLASDDAASLKELEKPN